ncbi:MAG: four-carbon acid sugar kinase family protein [Chloroflexi bacterium]|nr:four-carbon acid sugar kinase family protein [Chloroflexota bacterium]
MTGRMAVVADDITGANDIGIMFAKWDYLTHVYSIDDGGYSYDPTRAPQPDVCILDTNSRLDDRTLAYDKVFAATHLLQQAGWQQFFNKTCSVFRGNIGTEFDAMLDALGQEFAVVVLGFPKNGRTTVNGIHYVRGVPLAESEFRHDPIHPMTRSNLVDILQSQTERRVGLLTHEVIARGPAQLREEIEARRGSYNYLILDVVDQAALATIARAVHDLPVLCGSSAIAEELPPVWGPPLRREGFLDGRVANGRVANPPLLPGAVLVVAGSLMPQTRAQLDHLRDKGLPFFTLDTARLFDATGREAEIARLADALIGLLADGRDAVLRAPNDPTEVAAAHRAAAERGLTNTVLGRLVSATLADITYRVVQEAGARRLVIAGGETSAAVTRRLNISGLRIWKEIQPGLPSCLTLTEPPLLLVLKSGSFGSPDFLEQAIEHVKEP